MRPKSVATPSPRTEGSAAETTARALFRAEGLLISAIGHAVSEMGYAGREGPGPTCKVGRSGRLRRAATT